MVVEKQSRYTCKCLNIKIQAFKPTDNVPSELALEAGFRPVYVNQDGIVAAHPQLTLRIRSKATPIEGTPRSALFMSLACLMCRTLVYRVHQVSSTRVSYQEGPVIPSAGWVEEDIVRTPSGWIEVFEDVLTDSDIIRREASPQYSRLFSLILPPLISEPLSTSPVSTFDSAEPISPPSLKYLASMEPLFPDISSTADPVYKHLSSIALHQSNSLRAQAEQEVSEVVNSKIAQVAQAERELRLQVQTLLETYREGLRIAESEARPTPSYPRPWKDATSSSELSLSHPYQSVNDFVPEPVPPRTASSESQSQSQHRVSTLSASLKTSSFQHPKLMDDTTAGSQPSSVNSSLLPSYTDNRPSVHGGSLLDFKRVTDEGLNTATTYRYFVIEEEMERAQANRRDSEAAGSNESLSVNVTPQRHLDPELAVEEPPTPSSAKPKRRVTFDLKPTPEEDQEERPEPNEGEMVFDLEDEQGEDSKRAPESLVLPLVEPPAGRSTRTRGSKQSDVAGSLRSSVGPSHLSSSLGRPSPLRTMSTSPEENSTVQRPNAGERIAHSRGPSFDIPTSTSPSSFQEVRGVNIQGKMLEGIEDIQQQHDDEIRKVLAAGTPSHRAAWKSGGKAWGQFLHRGRERMFDSDNLVGDDDDDARKRETDESSEDELSASTTASGIPGSMPVRIRPLAKKKEKLSLASFRDRPETLHVPNGPHAAAAKS